MRQEKRLKPWTVVRLLPNLEKVVLGEFRSWSDADGHLQLLKRNAPADSLKWCSIRSLKLDVAVKLRGESRRHRIDTPGTQSFLSL
ncbi:MAG: hypothetical protein HC894_24800 [Microcoleus sp. SM1_3_4]|nr:hypothetical protein [Microcoleus sp. SM1_3_4]